MCLTKEEVLEKLSLEAAEGMASLQRLTAELQHYFAMRNFPAIIHMIKKVEKATNAIKEEAIESVVQQIEKGEDKNGY